MGAFCSRLLTCRKRAVTKTRRRLAGQDLVSYDVSTQDISSPFGGAAAEGRRIALRNVSSQLTAPAFRGTEGTTSRSSSTASTPDSPIGCIPFKRARGTAVFAQDDNRDLNCWGALVPCMTNASSEDTSSSGEAGVGVQTTRPPIPPNSLEWTCEDFARYLATSAHFYPYHSVLDRLRPTEQQLREMGVDIYRPCTSDGHRPCWMLEFQPAWNYALNAHGPELIQKRPNELAFRTLHLENRTEVDPEETLTSVCLALWVLSHHRCVTSLHLNGAAIAPCYIPVLYGLLRLHDNYVEIAVEGGDPVPHGQFRNCVLAAFRSMRRLRVLRLSGLDLLESAGGDMCTLVAKNVNLRALDLRLVRTDIDTTSSLFKELAKLDYFEELYFDVSTEEPLEMYEDLIPVILTSTVKKLTLNLDCDMSQFFKSLARNERLRELCVGCAIKTFDSLIAMQTSLVQNKTLRYLKVTVVLDKMPGGNIALKAFADIVGKNKGLQVLDLSRSSFKTASPNAVELFSNALKLNVYLEKIYFCECDLNCSDVRRLMESLSADSPLKNLCIGSVEDTPLERALTLQAMTYGQRSSKVTVVWRNDDVPLLESTLSDFRRPVFRKLHVRSGAVSPDSMALFLEALRNTEATLHTLFLDTPEVVKPDGALALASLFESSVALRKVAILYRTTEDTSLALLDGLAKSRSLTVLAIARWHLGGLVPQAFQAMLGKNGSLLQLDILRDEHNTHTVFYERLAHIAAGSRALVVLRVFDGERRVQALDVAALAPLRWHEMALRRALHVILAERMYAAASFLFDKIEPFQLVGHFLQNDNSWWPGSSMNRLEMAFESARSELRPLALIYECMPKALSRPDPQREFEEVLGSCLRCVVDGFQTSLGEGK